MARVESQEPPLNKDQIPMRPRHAGMTVLLMVFGIQFSALFRLARSWQ